MIIEVPYDTVVSVKGNRKLHVNTDAGSHLSILLRLFDVRRAEAFEMHARCKASRAALRGGGLHKSEAPVKTHLICIFLILL